MSLPLAKNTISFLIWPRESDAFTRERVAIISDERQHLRPTFFNQVNITSNCVRWQAIIGHLMDIHLLIFTILQNLKEAILF